MKNIDDLKELVFNNAGFKFNIKVIANSKVNSIEFSDELIKIKIMARAQDGKANKAIIEYLSKTLKISKSKISITHGEKSSLKTIQIIN